MAKPRKPDHSSKSAETHRAGSPAPAISFPPGESENPNALIGRLISLRGTVRRRLVAYGIFAVMAGGIAAFLTIIALDWMVRLPMLLRAFGTVCFVAGFFASSWYWIIVPFRTNIRVDELAATLEQHFEPLQERLSSTVNFLASGEARASRMAREVVDSTANLVREIRFESALSVRPILMRGVVFGIGVLALLVFSLAAPHWTFTGICRYARPWGPTEWPRTVQIQPIGGDKTIAIGDSVTLETRIERGLSASLRPVVRLRAANGNVGHTSTFALTREGGGKFSTTLDSVTEGLDYWFEAGDDSTEISAAHIRVVPRPEVVEATARVEPPAYVSNRSSNLLDLTEGPANAVSGATITVSIRSSKPIASDSEKSQCGLRRDDGTLIPLQIEHDDDQRLVTTFPLAESINFRVELHDIEGFSNRGSTTYTIRALPDAAPTVTILSPQAVAELTPHGAVELAIRAEDDFGIRTMGLEIEDPHGGDRRTLDLTTEARLSPMEQGIEANVSYLWHVESLGASPGDVFVYVAAAVDNRGGEADSGQIGRSSAMRLKFVSDSELELRIREDLALIENRLRQAANDQSENRDRTALLSHSDPSPFTPKESESATGVANFEVRLARQLRELSSRLDGASRRLALNSIGDSDTTSRLASAGATLDSVALGPLAAASVSLERARSSNHAEVQQEEIKSTVQAQDSAVDQIRSVVRELSQWGAFQGVLSRARELLDRQSALQAGANELSRSLLGKTVESLTPEEATALRKLQREQDQLAGDVDQQLARMQQLTETMKDKDPAGAESVEAGLRAARALDAVKHARAAAQAIEGNRTAAAAIEQKAASQAIHKMIDALRERETRELAELRKRIDRAEEEVSALIEEQTQIRTASLEAAKLGLPTEPFNALADSETTLERNARLLSDEIVEMERAVSAGRFVRDSATPMHSAALSLSQREGETAVARQTDAIDLLRKALDDLQAIARRSEEDEFKRTLDHIEEELTSLLTEQTEINRGISGLRDVVRQIGRLGRTEAREATRLGRTQGELRTRVDDMLPDLRQAAVYQWALQRVVHWMDVSRTALEERQVDDELLATTDRIVREIRKLIGAISDTRDLPMSSEFAEADGAGGGDGQQAKGVSVPTVAELIVLRTMQNDINTRTRDLSASTGEGEPSEADLRQLQAIGEDQAEVRRLTELVTKKSQNR